MVRRGKYIFTGNSKGKILIVDGTTLAQKACFRVTQTAAVNNAVKVRCVRSENYYDKDFCLIYFYVKDYHHSAYYFLIIIDIYT